ncbi:MAG: hypothetical protein LAT51_13570 [Flavobacteriaceae bacterium]|nr:hypothetical protein [Flavobacteriaceae bacterium]
MKKVFLLGAFTCLAFLMASFNSIPTSEIVGKEKSVDLQQIDFKLKGNGKSLVRIGVGKKVGQGSCCTGVSKHATVSFRAKVGDVVYDAETKKVLLTLTADSNHKIYQL